MKPKVSVIVPVYNTEKYIRKCVDSIINQTLKDIEIILVDDGSTDSCHEILDEYSTKDNRVIVIHKENGGQGSARNMGLDIAKGQYIGFVDSDDWVDLDMYEKLYTNAKLNEADMVVCNRKVFNEDGLLKTSIDVGQNSFINVNGNIADFIIQKLLCPYTVSTCNRIYSNEIVKKLNLRFESVQEVGSEDALFNYCFLLDSGIVTSINNTYHNQLAREGSTTRSYKIGAMNRTGKLIEGIYKYSESRQKREIGEVIAPIMLLFFQQWNYNLIKTYGKQNLKRNIKLEHKQASNNLYVKRAEKAVICDVRMVAYLKKMGFSIKGRLFIKSYMFFSLCNLNTLAANIRVIL